MSDAIRRLAFTASALFALAWGDPLSAGVIRLAPQATVSAPIVSLGAIAEILVNDPAERKKLELLEIKPAPEPGGKTWIEVREVKDILYRRGFRLDSIEFAGSSKCEVQSGGPPGPAEEPAESLSETRWKNEIVGVIRSALASDQTPAAAPRVRIEADMAAKFLSEHQTDAWDVLAPSDWREGWQQAELEVRFNQQTYRFPLRVQIAHPRPAVIPRRSIAKDQTITQDDVMVDYQVEAGAEFVSDLREVVGMQAKKELLAGKPILTRDVRKPPVVFRGQPVSVIVHYGSAWLEKSFTAADDGGIGDWIEVYDPEQKTGRPHEHQVRVLAPHRAELPMNAPPSRSAGRVNQSRPRASAGN